MSERDSEVAPVSTSDPLALTERWEDIVTDDRNRWTETGGDEGFWATHADEYDRRFVGKPVGLSRICSLVGPSDTVLEIGPGTGRYTRPLARRVSKVTAIEASSSMATTLDRNLTSANCRENVEIVEEEWPTADTDGHDWVVAGWSLYRQPDLRACMDQIIETANQGFVIIDSPGSLPPHRRIAVRAGDALASPPPRQAFYCGLLADRGRYPSVETEPKTRERRADSRTALVENLLSDALNDPLAHAEALDPWLHQEPDATDGTWCYRYTVPAAVISYVDDASGQPPMNVTGESQAATVEVGR